ncbi:MAG: hypothetical protein ACP5OG_01645 [Candidatus Nanoarchaeia archaeon]
MKIIIDNGNGEFDGNVDVSSDENIAKITYRPSVILHTSDILKCVGLGLIENTKKGVKRGLTHLFYNLDSNEKANEDNGIMVPKKEVCIKIKKDLDQLLENFSEPRAILVYNNFRKGRDNQEGNPLANYIYYHLLDKGVGLVFPDNKINSSLSGKIEIPISKKLVCWNDEYTQTYYKHFGLTENSVRVMHMGLPKAGEKYGKLLNPGSIEIPLDLNS